MGQLDPETMAMLSIFLPTAFGSIIVTVLIIRYKLKRKELEMRGSDAELGPVVDALRDDVEQLADMQEHTRGQLAQMQERLDFAERLLTAGRAPQEDRGG
jgi:hypothetical protein